MFEVRCRELNCRVSSIGQFTSLIACPAVGDRGDSMQGAYNLLERHTVICYYKHSDVKRLHLGINHCILAAVVPLCEGDLIEDNAW